MRAKLAIVDKAKPGAPTEFIVEELKVKEGVLLFREEGCNNVMAVPLSRLIMFNFYNMDGTKISLDI